MAQTVKLLPAVWETRVRSLGWEDPLEKEMASTPVLLPGKFHGRSTLGRLQSTGSQSYTTVQPHLSRILSIVPSALQRDLLYPLYGQKLTSADPDLPLHPSPKPLPLGSHQSVLYVCDSVYRI